MTRHEFEQAMNPMCKALGVRVNRDQAQAFFDEFQRHDRRDFAQACRELALGQPGYLPKLVFFRDNVLAAQEMRLAREHAQREGETTRFWRGETLTDEEFEHGRQALAKIKAMLKMETR